MVKKLARHEKAAIERSVRKCLERNSLLEHFKYSLREVDTGGFVLIVSPIEKTLDKTGCGALTLRGRQCRLDPVRGESYCLTHLHLRNENDAI